MSINTPELVLLDLDGTLIDSIPDLAWSVNKTLYELAIPKREIHDIRNWVGDGLEKLLHRSLTNDFNGEAEAVLFAQAMPILMRIYSENIGRLSRCYPGVREGLDQLTERNIKLGCVTNKSERFVGTILEKLGIIDDINLVIAGDTLPRKKPDPLPLLHAASYFNKEPAKSLMIGDSENDVKAARVADFQIVCVSYGYNHGRDIREARPDAVIDSIADVVTLFQ